MSKSLQQRLFDQILLQYPKRILAIDKLSSLLNLGRDAIYRRMRGDTILNPAELEQLAQHFQISLDSLVFGQTETVFFSFNGFDKGTRNFNDYLFGFEKEFEFMKNVEEDQTHFYYASMELPLFQSCFFPELICFKLYVWGLTVLGYKDLSKQSFSVDMLPAPLLEITKRIQELYLKIPSTELWGINVVDNTLNQIEYHFGSGHFRSAEEAILLCDKLVELTFHMQQMAEAGKKFLPGQKIANSNGQSFALFHNEMVFTSNTLLATTPNNKVLFTSLSNPHFLKSTDDRLCNYMEDWFKGVVSKSSAISVQAEKQRLWFFNRLRKKIENVRQRIEITAH